MSGWDLAGDGASTWAVCDCQGGGGGDGVGLVGVDDGGGNWAEGCVGSDDLRGDVSSVPGKRRRFEEKVDKGKEWETYISNPDSAVVPLLLESRCTGKGDQSSRNDE